MSPKGIQLIGTAAVVAVAIVAIVIGLVVRPVAVVPDPARYMPGDPVAFIGMNGWAEVVQRIEDSEWWRSLWSRIQGDKRVKAALKNFELRYRRRFQTTIQSHLRRLQTLLGGRIWIGFYSGLRGISLLAAVRPRRSVSLDEVLARLRRFSENLGHKTPPAKWITHQGRRFRQLRLAGRTVYVFSPDRKTIFVSFSRRLIQQVIVLVQGKKAPRLLDDPLYRLIAGARLRRLRAFIRWDKLPARKRTGEDILHQVLDTIKSVRLVSNLIETVVSVDFRPGTATSLLGGGLPGAVLKSPSLLPRSPLVYFGSCGHRLSRVWKGLLAADTPGQKALMKLDRDLGRTFGVSGLAELLDRTGNEAAVAVLGLHPGPLPLPQVLVLVRMKDEKTARTFMPRMVAALKKHRDLGRLVFETRRAGGRTIHYITVPRVGRVGAVDIGPFIVASNNLDLLRDTIERRHADPTAVWHEALRIQHPSTLLFLDLTQILRLAPDSLPYLAPWLRLPRPVLDELPQTVQAAINVLSFLKGVTLWTRWEAKKRELTLGLRLSLADAEVTSNRVGEALFLSYFTPARSRLGPVKAGGRPKPK